MWNILYIILYTWYFHKFFSMQKECVRKNGEENRHLVIFLFSAQIRNLLCFTICSFSLHGWLIWEKEGLSSRREELSKNETKMWQTLTFSHLIDESVSPSLLVDDVPNINPTPFLPLEVWNFQVKGADIETEKKQEREREKLEGEDSEVSWNKEQTSTLFTG